jgi:hypothetical protein
MEGTMFRRVLGFAILAVVVVVGLKLAVGLLGFALGLAVTVVFLAAGGYLVYVVLTVVSPGLARSIREAIRGSPKTPAPPGRSV